MSEVLAARAGVPETRSNRRLAGWSAPVARLVPVLVVLLALLGAWSVAATIVGAPAAAQQAGPDASVLTVIRGSWWIARPVVPSPAQVAMETWKGVFGYPVTNRRSLIYHAGITLEAAVAGFVLGTLVGIALAIMIVHIRLLDRGLHPWIVVAQSIPVVATAPMVVAIMGSLGLSGLFPKAIIAASLCFFPVTVGVTRGLCAAEPIQLELLQTYSATKTQVFRKLRWPASLAYLFPSLKIAMALAISGAIVGELPTGAQAGLGARLLLASYNGLMLMLWATLVVACLTAGLATGVIALIERAVMGRGSAP